MQCTQNQTLLCERNNLMQTVTVLMSLCAPSTSQSPSMWLDRQYSMVRLVVEQFHGDDVVIRDVTLLKNHVRQVNGVDLESGNGSCSAIRHSNQDPVYGSSAYPKKVNQTKRSEFSSRWSTLQQYVKEQGVTSLGNVNKVEKDTVSLDEQQCEVFSV